MTNYIRLSALSLLFFLCVLPAVAETPGPVGKWLVKDGTAHIRIVSCDGKLWGFIRWVKEPGTDEHNPDPAKRSRSVVGMPILLGLAPAKEEWDGNIYNADNGKTYSGDISLKSADVLHVSGCVMGGIFCGGEDWSRLPDDMEKPGNEICRHVSQE